jgi:hypothetical protein
MAGVAQTAPTEFWQPPSAEVAAATPVRPRVDEVCAKCTAEFMAGAGFCHRCGLGRVQEGQTFEASQPNTRSLRRWLGISGASLSAFVVGLICILVAIIGGAAYSNQAFPDFPAIMLWRMQWLVAAVAAFVAGILLKRPYEA